MRQRRFIPAGAGNTLPSVLTIIRNAVYPRWRGEHEGIGVTIQPGCGLSPLARGTRGCRPISPPAVRFIPAGAGNTSTKNYLLSLLTVYPRWRGEHTKTIYLF
ncbi:hypothetical protein STMDT12_C29860 [Salmonella enterica subsp. enterica serovar Typhimurium str. T000240]|nr:hypothetical protein STMDT12_C29860 [Salmonella enterica subsp. enterica serovar Typhimurium str. T000240]